MSCTHAMQLMHSCVALQKAYKHHIHDTLIQSYYYLAVIIQCVSELAILNLVNRHQCIVCLCQCKLRKMSGCFFHWFINSVMLSLDLLCQYFILCYYNQRCTCCYNWKCAIRRRRISRCWTLIPGKIISVQNCSVIYWLEPSFFPGNLYM